MKRATSSKNGVLPHGLIPVSQTFSRLTARSAVANWAATLLAGCSHLAKRSGLEALDSAWAPDQLLRKYGVRTRDHGVGDPIHPVAGKEGSLRWRRRRIVENRHEQPESHEFVILTPNGIMQVAAPHGSDILVNISR